MGLTAQADAASDGCPCSMRSSSLLFACVPRLSDLLEFQPWWQMGWLAVWKVLNFVLLIVLAVHVEGKRAKPRGRG